MTFSLNLKISAEKKKTVATLKVIRVHEVCKKDDIQRWCIGATSPRPAEIVQVS